jgi:hypothetical protein
MKIFAKFATIILSTILVSACSPEIVDAIYPTSYKVESVISNPLAEKLRQNALNSDNPKFIITIGQSHIRKNEVAYNSNGSAIGYIIALEVPVKIASKSKVIFQKKIISSKYFKSKDISSSNQESLLGAEKDLYSRSFKKLMNIIKSLDENQT